MEQKKELANLENNEQEKEMSNKKGEIQEISITVIRGDRFEGLKKRLDGLDTLDEKIACVIRERTRYLQGDTLIYSRSVSSVPFEKQCDLELEMLKELRTMEQKEIVSKHIIQSKGKIGEREARQKSLGLTRNRAFLAMNYLLNNLRADCKNTKKIEFISFLTGYSRNTIEQAFSELNKELYLNSDAYKNDVKVIFKYFKNLGLTELANQVIRDFNSKKIIIFNP